MTDFFTADKPRLGFGFMRMPELPDGTKDLKTACAMVDEFMAGGFTYFDTAYIYAGSEALLGEALVKRYPRESFQVTTKLPIINFSTLEECRAMLEESMARLGVDYLDVCLIHALNAKANEKAERLGVWDYIAELKSSGRARHIGFSFHDSAAALDGILTRHPETEVVQMQINYIDWNDPQVDSKGCWETAVKHNKPVIIMEPVKGGLLVAKDERIAGIFQKAAPDKSLASWALRFAGSHKNVFTVLSGMSDVAQVRDNLKTFKSFEPITPAEQSVIDEAVRAFRAFPQYPCTGCRYCMENCPQGIDIPMIMKQMNYVLRFNPEDPGERYRLFARKGHLASDCLGCGACEAHCPQSIEIHTVMKKAAELFDKQK